MNQQHNNPNERLGQTNPGQTNNPGTDKDRDTNRPNNPGQGGQGGQGGQNDDGKRQQDASRGGEKR